MVLFMEGIYGMNVNCVIFVNVLVGYLFVKLRYDVWIVIVGLWYEDVDLLKKDYMKEDLVWLGKVCIEILNYVCVLILGVGLYY